VNDHTEATEASPQLKVEELRGARFLRSAPCWPGRAHSYYVPAQTFPRTLPEALNATQEIVATAGDFRLVGNPIRIADYQPDYRPPPTLGQDGLA
jgi:hypothetical protein